MYIKSKHVTSSKLVYKVCEKQCVNYSSSGVVRLIRAIYNADVNICLFGTVLIVQSDRCREERPVETLLHASRIQQSVTEGEGLFWPQSICFPPPAHDPDLVFVLRLSSGRSKPLWYCPDTAAPPSSSCSFPSLAWSSISASSEQLAATVCLQI